VLGFVQIWRMAKNDSNRVSGLRRQPQLFIIISACLDDRLSRAGLGGLLDSNRVDWI